MNIKALRAFRHTLETGSIAEASRKMHLSASAISRLISGLEGELRLNFFEREGRSLSPTSEARAFYREAGRILDNLEDVRRVADEIRAGYTERLRIVTMPRIATALVAPSVKRFHERAGDARLTVDVRTRRDAERWLVGPEYDLGVGSLPITHPEIKTRALLQARAQAVLPPGHILAEQETVDIGDLLKEPFIALMQGLLLRMQVDEVFASEGLENPYAYEVASSRFACQLVAEGVGVTIADALTVKFFPENAVLLRPLTPERWMTFGTLQPRGGSLPRSGEEFIESLAETAAILAREDPMVRLSG